MILCLDSGNSRIKYGVWADAAWLDSGALAHADWPALGQLVARWPTPTRIMLANVAGPVAEANIRQALAAWGESIEIVRSSAAACGVCSHYQYPERLGVDRWCALIGARSLYAGALLVVMAGTATTIDTLDAEGNFLGGFILPGQHLMLSALARDTAGLPFADGQYADLPRNTEDAIVSGAIEAQAGAIERAWRRLPAGERHCLLSGGNAPLLAQHLAMPVVQMENLPLFGLKEMARQTLS
jgi:type III pantothenate kinase